MQRRNDPVNNGAGHYRRKVVNLSPGQRFELDRYEQATLRLIADLDAFLAEEQQRQTRRGDPGE